MNTILRKNIQIIVAQICVIAILTYAIVTLISTFTFQFFVSAWMNLTPFEYVKFGIIFGIVFGGSWIVARIMSKPTLKI